jgi:hypothetical protein
VRVRAREQFGAKFKAPGILHCKYSDGCSPSGGQALYADCLGTEVIRPLIAPRVKEGDHLARGRINSRQVWTLAEIATVTCECQIVEIVRTAVLPCHDVLNVVGEAAVLLIKQAVFTAIPGTAADELSPSGV